MELVKLARDAAAHPESHEANVEPDQVADWVAMGWAVNPPDLDGDNRPGGSLTKAEIMADLDRLGIDYDARFSRDKLDALLRKDKAHREATVNASVEG